MFEKYFSFLAMSFVLVFALTTFGISESYSGESDEQGESASEMAYEDVADSEDDAVDAAADSADDASDAAMDAADDAVDAAGDAMDSAADGDAFGDPCLINPELPGC